MTVCVAALADVGKSIVLACDSMLSGGEFSGDKVAHKLYPLSGQFHWCAMAAGDDITHIAPVIDGAVLGLLGLTDVTNTAENVERTVVAAYQNVRIRHAEDMVLAPIGMTMESFLQKTEWQNNLVDELRAVDLGCQVLVAGFDWTGDGHIFTVEHPGIVRNHDFSGWASIGNGAYSAISMLLFHSVSYDMELARVIYHVCEAKFMAESAPGVGKHTVVKVMKPDMLVATPSELSSDCISKIRDEWESQGKPRIPTSALDGIREILETHPFGKLSK
jgi:20S proteasome alpha/beta subunit